LASISFGGLALIIFAAGFGARITMVSVITGIIDASHVARLYTLISTIEELARLVGSPIVQSAWAQGITWGGKWMGFPYVVLAVSYKLGSRQWFLSLTTKSLLKSYHYSGI